jgi:pilus assembly protein CpaC
MSPGQVPPTPGDELNQPNDLEFYFLNRIEGRTGRDWRATTDYDGQLLRRVLKMEQDHMQGLHGFCEGDAAPAKFHGINLPTNARTQVNP